MQLDSRYKLLLFISVILEDRTLQPDAELHGGAKTFAWLSHLSLFIFLADLRIFGKGCGLDVKLFKDCGLLI